MIGVVGPVYATRPGRRPMEREERVWKLREVASSTSATKSEGGEKKARRAVWIKRRKRGRWDGTIRNHNRTRPPLWIHGPSRP